MSTRRSLRSLIRRLLLGPIAGWIALACSGGPRAVSQEGRTTPETSAVLVQAVAAWNAESMSLVGYPVFELGEGDVTVLVDSSSVRLRCGDTADEKYRGCAELGGNHVWVPDAPEAALWTHELGHILGLLDRPYPEDDTGVMTYWPDRQFNNYDRQALLEVLTGS
jgi:hypothetical protein